MRSDVFFFNKNRKRLHSDDVCTRKSKSKGPRKKGRPVRGAVRGAEAERGAGPGRRVGPRRGQGRGVRMCG